MYLDLILKKNGHLALILLRKQRWLKVNPVAAAKQAMMCGEGTPASEKR